MAPVQDVGEHTGGQAQQNADRITMLPQTMGSAPPGGVDLIAFTPGTSLRLGDATGVDAADNVIETLLSQGPTGSAGETGGGRGDHQL